MAGALLAPFIGGAVGFATKSGGSGMLAAAAVILFVSRNLTAALKRESPDPRRFHFFAVWIGLSALGAAVAAGLLLALCGPRKI